MAKQDLEKAKELLAKHNIEKRTKCSKEISEILKKYNCNIRITEPQMVIYNLEEEKNV